MNNSDLADALAVSNGLTKTDARKLVDGVFAAIADAAAKGDETAINGFGKFKIKDTPAREGRNPSTGATIQIAASKKLTFAPAKAIKDKLNG
ncbi:MAG: hypothetical protein RLZZ444_2934 [Pseudomonadota bacterium]|jgi:DNA-binding protein HU-beta